MQESQGAGQAFHLGGACAIFTHPHLVQDNLAIGKARSLSFGGGEPIGRDQKKDNRHF